MFFKVRVVGIAGSSSGTIMVAMVTGVNHQVPALLANPSFELTHEEFAVFESFRSQLQAQ